MDPAYSDQDYEDSYSLTRRSRAGSRVSSTDGLFQNLQIVDSPRSVPRLESRPTSSQGPLTPNYLSPAPPHSSSFLSSPASVSYSSFPLLPSDISNAGWSQEETPPGAAPLLRVDPAQDYSQIESSPAQLAPSPSTATMSTVALHHIEHRFDIGRGSSMTWPGLESFAHDMATVPHFADISLTPPSGSRSVTSSPPRSGMQVEQRERRKQMEQARRDSKQSIRRIRTGSNPYVQPTPVTMAELPPSSSSMPMYATAAPASLGITETATSMAPSQYLPSYTPPPLADHNQQSVYSTYSSLQPNSGYMYQDLTAPFGGQPTTGPSVPLPYVPRPSGIDMYPMQAGVGPGPAGSSASASAQEAGAAGGHVRVVQSRPKPQCWDHGCNGRQFSTFSNLLRHQREKSGQAAKATCPNCGAEFTRTTARNGHMAHDKCKQRRNNA